MKKILFFALLSVLLTGCLKKQTDLADNVIIKKTTPVCDSDALCKKMWDAAGEWVQKYSPQGIKEYGDTVIQSEDRTLGEDELEITVKKVIQPGGKYKIVIDVLCTNLMSGCETERRNMLAFNSKLSSMMSGGNKQQADELFTVNRLLKSWLNKYEQLFNKGDDKTLSGLFHLPVTIIEKDRIQVLTAQENVVKYMTEVRHKLAKVNATYVRFSGMDVVAESARAAFLTVDLTGYDEEAAGILAQKLHLNLVAVENGWQLVTMTVVQ